MTSMSSRVRSLQQSHTKYLSQIRRAERVTGGAFLAEGMLQRIEAGHPAKLLSLVSSLTGESLAGFCLVIQGALEMQREVRVHAASVGGGR